MKLLDRIRKAAPEARIVAPAPAPAPAPKLRLAGERSGPVLKGNPVEWSQDLARVLSLPRRTLGSTWTQADADAFLAEVRGPSFPGTNCVCAKLGKRCPTHLLPIQLSALMEARQVGGLVGAIGVGHGKTLIDLLLPFAMRSKRAVLLIPANLRPQLLDVDWHYYGGHWKLPNLAGGRLFSRDARPELHVLTYNKLSTQEGTDLLGRIKPDLIICDEAHNLKDPKSARTGRFLRYIDGTPGVRGVVQSGTLNTRSIKDSAHLYEFALGEGSPLPVHPPTIESWASALDPLPLNAPPGALAQLGGGNVREAFREWRNRTPGVVSTDESAVGMSLVIRKRDPGPIPDELRAHLATARKGTRPDGEESQEELQRVTWARQLGAGFYHRWRYPKVYDENERVLEDDAARAAVIKEWFARRQCFNREIREMLYKPREHLDSPGLLVKAAIRAYMDPPYDGDKPLWRSQTWPKWAEYLRRVEHVTQAVWVSDWLVQDAAKWAARKGQPGIVWVEFPELGERIARAAGVPFYGGGDEASELIVRETGKRSVVASLKAHGTGKNLTMFSRALFVNPPADGAAWEQAIGRIHRQGQLADEVEVEVYAHTAEYRRAFSKAREFATFIQQVEGTPQKLLLATYEWPVALEDVDNDA